MIFKYSDLSPKQYKNNKYVKDIVEVGMCLSHGQGGCKSVKAPYINISKILEDHFYDAYLYC